MPSFVKLQILDKTISSLVYSSQPETKIACLQMTALNQYQLNVSAFSESQPFCEVCCMYFYLFFSFLI